MDDSIDTKETNIKATKASTESDQAPLDTSVQSLDSILALFKAGDDTSNFVALSLLRSILDDRKELREDKDIVVKCWNAIPSNFLSRLLKARPNEKRSRKEAQSMVGLAVAVIQAFVNLLPSKLVETSNMICHADQLVAAVPLSSPATVSQISQILLALNFPSLLFTNILNATQSTSEPSLYLFIKMLLIDFKSTIPSQQEKLNEPEYSAISTRIAESFDVISNFIGYLVQTLDDNNDDERTGVGAEMQFEPSQLLQLRTDISETLSLAIEHLRDRYDASVAGAAGLHPSARTSTGSSSSAPKTITWQSSTTSMPDEPLTLSEIRSLALWLREDDNEALRKEAAGIMDALLSLFSSSEASKADFCSPVLIALEGILTVPEGVEAFLREEGWNILVTQLRKSLMNGKEVRDADLGVEVVRVLLAVVESDVTGPAKEDWMVVVEMAAEALGGLDTPDEKRSDVCIAMGQLAVELLSKAPKNLRRRYSKEASKVLRLATGKVAAAHGDRQDGLIEIMEGLEVLGISID